MAQVLRPLIALFPAEDHPKLMVGLDAGEDAAVYRLDDSRALVFTTDFITPIVDDPFDFGAIAAANALSDVFSMGGEPLIALNISGFPSSLSSQDVEQILRGGAHTAKSAGCVVCGGHTIGCEEPFYGLAVVGLAHPEHLFVKNRVQPGDVLLLTKPLGTGVIMTAFKRAITSDRVVAAAIDSMKRLNQTAMRILRAHEVTACTDVTGFSLLGHALDLAQRSSIGLRMRFSQLPILPGAIAAAEQAAFPGATERNRAAYGTSVKFTGKIVEPTVNLLFSPETSGGLLAAVPRKKLAKCVQELREADVAVEPVAEVDESLESGTLSVNLGE